MARSKQEQLRRDLVASYDAIKNSFFWKTYTKALQENHDAALLIVRTKASGTEAELRCAAALCSAFHTALTLPDVLKSGGRMIDEGDAQEDMEGTEE